jgi:Asp-tRNA(Asn)/Glu-tRNA(Gln) amidotransferase A subunit family amidase
VSLRPKVVLPEEFAPIVGLRIALSLDLGAWLLDAEVVDNTLRTADALRRAGAVVEPVELHLQRAVINRLSSIHFALIFGAAAEHEATAHRELLNDYALEFADASRRSAKDAGLLEEVMLQQQISEPIGALFEDFDALICPTVTSRGLEAGDSYVGHGLTIGDTEVRHYLFSMMTLPFNVLSRCPVLAVPSGFAGNGVPTGIQIVGRTYDDETVFRIGAALEHVQPWFDVPDRRPSL